MKRHVTLIPFSRDHHEALILSRLMQRDAPAYKGLPSDNSGKASYAFAFFHDKLLPHFQAEEQCIAAVLMGKDPQLDTKLTEMIQEHRQLSDFFQSIPGSDSQETVLHDTGKLLEKHIRSEERELFPLIEQLFDDEFLVKISDSLTAFTHEKGH